MVGRFSCSSSWTVVCFCAGRAFGLFRLNSYSAAFSITSTFRPALESILLIMSSDERPVQRHASSFFFNVKLVVIVKCSGCQVTNLF
jgi:hypothetical protein